MSRTKVRFDINQLNERNYENGFMKELFMVY